ncbi:MAG: hypothetical protein LUD27_00410, partial [Clostridia bacterium]|nr:hypothetical protein [Clostridia bacterium]
SPLQGATPLKGEILRKDNGLSFFLAFICGIPDSAHYAKFRFAQKNKRHLRGADAFCCVLSI